MRTTVRALIATTIVLAACGTQSPPPPRNLVVWKPVGNWSGRGNLQTENFTSDSGGFRVHWSMKNESKKDAGRLRVVLRSMDSGREIVDAVDVQGAGDGVEEIAAERPRWYYLTIDAADAEWTVSIDERIDAQRPD